MSLVDWAVLLGSLFFIVVYGTFRNRHHKDLDSYLLASRGASWRTIAVSIMATQASAITFLSTPGQAYVDGMRFIQFYLGLPVAMVVLSVTAVPVYARLKVYTAYEYLEKRFDLKTRTLATFLFLVPRALSTGVSIYATSIVLSVLLGWNIYVTNTVIGGLVIVYTASGGARAVNWTQTHQFAICILGMAAAFVVIVHRLPADVSFLEATQVAGKLGRLKAIDFAFDPKDRYNFWSGLVGGFFLQLSYFGTDQSQVGRYLGGRSTTESRLGLLFNGLVKIPMQFGILLLGVMIYVFYQFNAPPVLFNPVEVAKARSGPQAAAFQKIEERHTAAFEARRTAARAVVDASRARDDVRLEAARVALVARERDLKGVRADAVKVAHASTDTNYIFLTFVLHYLPAGLVGLILAVVFAASMSSNSAALNALASTTVVDVYGRLIRKGKADAHYVRVSKLATVFWGLLAIAFAQFSNKLGTLIEVVNILGSLFYGTILGVFLLAFYFKRVGGTATFVGAIAGEIAVVLCWAFSPLAFLWYNVVGCGLTIAVALFYGAVVRPSRPAEGPVSA